MELKNKPVSAAPGPSAADATRYEEARLRANAHPESIEDQYIFAETCREIGNRLEAIMQYQKVIALDPNRADFYLGRLREFCTPKELTEIKVPPPIIAFYHDIPGVLLYPFHGVGIGILVGGTLLMTVLFVIAAAAWFVSAALFIIFQGYLFAYYMDVASTSSMGEREPPDWPDFSDVWDTAILPFFQFMASSIVPIVALVLYAGFRRRIDTGFFSLAAVGLAYVPMGWLAVSILRSGLVTLNPVFILTAIANVLGDYLIALVLLFVFLIPVGLLQKFVLPLLALRGLPFTFGVQFAQMALTLYTWMVIMRVLGLLYRQNQQKLGWIR